MGYRGCDNCPDPSTLRDLYSFSARSLLLAVGRSQCCSQPTRRLCIWPFTPESGLQSSLNTISLKKSTIIWNFTNMHQEVLWPSVSAVSDSKDKMISVTLRTKIQAQVLIQPLLFWASLRPLALAACVYCGGEAEQRAAHGSDLNCVISTRQGAGLHLDMHTYHTNSLNK